MERIIVKEFKQFPTAKGNGLSVVMNGNRKATVAAWHAQEQDYIMNDVGIGGSFEADIVVKGEYTNIENVNFDSAKKNTTMTSKAVLEQKPEEADMERRQGLLSVRDIQIIAQCMTKCVYYGKADATLKDVLGTYHEAVKDLEQNG